MVRSADQAIAGQFVAGLRAFEHAVRTLDGICAPAARACLIEQLVDSTRRVRFVAAIASRGIGADRADPSSEHFDPIRAAARHQLAGDSEEAAWIAFLATHFGPHHRTRWRLVRDVYGGLGAGRWDWPTASADPAGMTSWIAANIGALRAGSFGNHRRYETLKATGTGTTIESYVAWIGPARLQTAKFSAALTTAAGDPGRAFDELYRSMRAVHRFGRLARFDYLAMIGKLGVAAIAPTSLYLWDSATGPLQGARRILGPAASTMPTPAIEQNMESLCAHLGVGPQVLEDALCNWNKSPTTYRRFMG